MDAVLRRKQVQCFLRAPMRQFDDDLLQFGIPLAVDAIEVRGFHTGFLQFLKEPAGFD